MKHAKNRKGFSLIELEVAFIIFMIAMAGLCPLVVMQSKHLRKIEGRLSQNTVYYLKPSADEWARKLGTCASIMTSDPGGSAADPILIIDDGDAGFSTVGADWKETQNTDAYLDKLLEVKSGDGSQIGRWYFSGLKPGWYEVLATWAPHPASSDAAPFTIFEGSTEIGSMDVDQQEDPTGDEYAGSLWQSLGTVQISGTELTVELNNSAAKKILADAVRLVRVENNVRVTSVEKSIDSEEVTVHVTVTDQVSP